mmetsp:Transcript_16814/g.16063  ORF Transcript_16814/g.16063 Transcript_16814/m.16063 type:complete len:92 (-) Transcript_16814:1029-1304(-)
MNSDTRKAKKLDSSFQATNLDQSLKRQRSDKIENVFDLIGSRIKGRLKGILRSRKLSDILENDFPDLYKQILRDLTHTKKDVNALNKERQK